MENKKRIWIANTLEEYARLKFGNTVAPWEDGVRASTDVGSYEWWYFDAALDGGGSLVIKFSTKDVFFPSTPLMPQVNFDYTAPDGTPLSRHLTYDPSEYSASEDGVDIRIGKNIFKGDCKHYDIHFECDDVSCDVSWDNLIPAWRPESGMQYFDDLDHYFAWLVGTPKGVIQGSIRTADQVIDLNGKCYHDHNWGNMGMDEMWHHWYWGRADIGDYTIVSAMEYGTEHFDYQNCPVFMIADKEHVLVDDYNYVSLREEDQAIDKNTGKPYHNRLIYDYNDGKEHYVITYIVNKVIVSVDMVDMLPEDKRIAAKKAGVSICYLRFFGKCVLEHYDGDRVTETVEGTAIWELPYYGETLLNYEYKR